MRYGLLAMVYAAQVLLSLLVWPNVVLKEINMLSALLVFLLPVPALVMVQVFSGRRLFWIFGLSQVASFLPAAGLLFQMKQHNGVGFFLWLILGVMVFLISGLSGVWGRAILRRMPWSMVLVSPALILSVEYLMLSLSQNIWLIPPPNVLLAYPLVAIPPLIQIASLTGVLGVSALVAFIATLAAIVLRHWLVQHGWKQRLGMDDDVVPFSGADWRKMIVLGAVAGGGLLVLLFLGNVEAARVEKQQAASERVLRAALLQSQSDPSAAGRWTRAVENASLRIYRGLMLQAKAQKAEVMVFTENAFPLSLPHTPRMWDDVRELIREADVPVILGAITEAAPGHSFNMWYYMDRNAKILGYYSKQALVPFGEYLPMRSVVDKIVEIVNRIFEKTYKLVKLTAIAMDNFDLQQGDESRLFTINGHKIFLTVCDEIKYPEYFRRGVAMGGEAVFAPNAANWFPHAAYHNRRLQMTALRAVENRRWVGYLSNMGGTAFIDAQGIIRQASPYATRSVDVHDLPMLDGRSFYTRWGDWFPGCWLLILFGFSLAALIRARRR